MKTLMIIKINIITIIINLLKINIKIKLKK